MGKTLLITEKPSVAREYASVLNVRDMKNGYVESETYIITWCLGHLITMSYPEKYNECYKRWRMEDLPFLPEEYKYEVIPSMKQQYQVIHKLMNLNSNEIDTIIYCGDAGREGELIGRRIRDFGGIRRGIKELRVWIDSFTEDEIKRGLRDAKPLSKFDGLADAGYARSYDDYLIGINLSRALSCKYGYQFNNMLQGTKYHSISVGRVMTTVMGMIIERENAIKEFVSTTYFKISAELENGLVLDWKINEKSAYFATPDIYQDKGFGDERKARNFICTLPNEVKIVSIEEKKEKKNPPYLYSLSELQSECTKRFKISPDKTLEVAQSLYEKKLTTYPRTDARVLSSAVAREIDKTIKGLEKYPNTKEYCQNIIEKGWDKNIINTKYTDDSKIGDHYAIIPTGQGFGVMSKLNSLECQVYDLIVRRFLCIFYSSAEYSKISVQALADGETFVTNSKVLNNPGYLVVASEHREENIENNVYVAIQKMKEGMLIHSEYKINKGKTEPSKRYTSGAIILAMENAGQFIEDEELRAQIKGSGIGTSATRAEILKKLIDISYIKVDQKTQILTPEKEGYLVYDIVKETVPELLTAKITAEWEKELDMISAGKMSVSEHEKGIKNYIETHIEIIKGKKIKDSDAQFSTREQQKEVIGICPECGNNILECERSFYCADYKNGCKWSLWKDNKYFAALGKKVTKTFVRELLNDGYGQVNGLKSKNGNKYNIRLRYVKKDKYYQFEKVNMNKEE